MQGLLGYAIRRLLWVPVILFAVSFLAFTVTRFGPGDPVTVLSPNYRDPEAFERVRRQRGLDKPFYQQYAIYMRDVLQGDFGESVTIYRGEKVWDIIWPRMLVSIQPGLVALIIAFSVGTVVGIFAAVRQGTWLDPFSISSFLFFQSIPVLVSLPFLVLIFVVKLGWLPAVGWGGPRVDVGPQDIALGLFSKHIILPAIALSLPSVAGIARLVRATTLSVLGEDYVRTARAKGLPEVTVVGRHVARNALLPLVTIIGLSLVGLLEGAFFTETILGIPGIGALGYQAATSRDYDVILALVLILATAFVVGNIVIDIVYTFIDPRIRYEGRGGA
jgi:ABC-type dipeptide/oligopeptide/nickel transport system permease component